MTPERKAQLLARLSELQDREVNRLVLEQIAGRILASEVSQALLDLAELSACVETCFAALKQAKKEAKS